MKFTEITLIVFCITLVLTGLSQLEIIPNAMEGATGGYTRSNINVKTDSYEIVNGTVVCSPESQKKDIVCQISYLEGDAIYSKIKEDTQLFGFSDIIRGARMVTDILYLSTYGAKDLFDYYVKACIEWEYNEVSGEITCVRRSTLYDLKYLFITPIYLIYVIALLELLTGRNISGDK